MNITLPVSSNEITKKCADWCREQSFIFQRNLEVSEMAFIAIALIALVVHNAIYNHYNYFRKQGIDDTTLDKIYNGSSFLVYVMLIFFIIYMTWLR